LHAWPATWQRAGRELFNKPDDWAGVPPWPSCRDYCIRHLPRADRAWLSVRLDEDWQCLWDTPYDSPAGSSRRRAEIPTEGVAELWRRRR
jgi:hypothetical protein